MSNIGIRPHKVLAFVLAAAALGAEPLRAGDFSVHPIRLDLGPAIKSGAIAVRNDGEVKLSFQVQALAWSQDETGKDRYEETQDLVYFPRLLSVTPGEENLIRVGSRRTLVDTEKTYRLFIEELPGDSKPVESGSAQVSVLMRFGAPVFVSPLKSEDRLTIERAELGKGILKFSAHNTGNRHQVFRSIDIKGTDAAGSPIFSLTLGERYLLAGASKSFTASVPAEQCGKIISMAIDIRTDKAVASRTFAVTPTMCP